MKKRFFTALCILIICFLCLAACGEQNPIELYFLDKFDVKVPDGTTIDGITRLYTVNTQCGFHGEGEHYAVFKLKKKPYEYMANFNKPADLESFEQHWLNCNFSDLDIPVEFKPDWDKGYYWKRFAPANGLGSDRLYLIYQPHNLRLILFVWLI